MFMLEIFVLTMVYWFINQQNGWGGTTLGGHQDLAVDRPTWTTGEWRWSCDRCMCGPPGGSRRLGPSCCQEWLGHQLQFQNSTWIKKTNGKETITLWKEWVYGLNWQKKRTRKLYLVFNYQWNLVGSPFLQFGVTVIWAYPEVGILHDTAQNGYVNMEHDDPPRDLVVVLSLWLVYRSLQMMFYSVNCYFFWYVTRCKIYM